MNRKYKYKGSEIDLDLLIHNLNHNYSSWADYTTKNPLQRQELDASFNEFIKAIKAGRISTLGTGQLEDSEGILTNQDANTGYYNEKGKYITSDEFNKLRKGKQKDYNQYMSNLHLVNFVNLIAEGVYSALTKRDKEKAKRKEEASKESIEAKLNAAWSFEEGDADLTHYWEKDPLDETTKKRGTTERIKLLSDKLKELYPNYQQDEKLNKLITLLDADNASFDGNIKIAMDEAGINSSWYNTFFKTDFTNPEEEKKKEQEEQKGKEEELNSRWKEYITANLPESNILYELSYINNPWESDDFIKTAFSYDKLGKILSSLTNDQTQYMKDGIFDLNKALNYLLSLLNTNDSRLNNLSDKQVNTVLEALLGASYYNSKKLFGSGYDVYTDEFGKQHNVIRIDPNSTNLQTKSALIYIDGKFQYVPLYSLLSGLEILKLEFLKLLPDWKPYIPQYKKQGGSIKKFDYGGITELYELGVNDRAKENNLTKKLLIEQDRKKSTTEFSKYDYIRLGTIGADVISLVSAFAPGLGTAISGATGAVSSIGTFAADWGEDGFLWSDLGNLATNLGLDIIGMIPGGGAASKAGKIGKALVKYVPMIIGALSTKQALENSPEIIKSFKKIGTDEELTLYDWQNIAQGIGAITGVGGATLRHILTKPVKLSDKIALQFKGNDEKVKTVAFTGEDASKIKNAKSIDEVKEVIKDYEDYGELVTAKSGLFGVLTQSIKEGPWYKFSSYRFPFTRSEEITNTLDVEKLRRWKKGKYNQWESWLEDVDSYPMALKKSEPILKKPRKPSVWKELENLYKGKTKTEIEKELYNTDKLVIDNNEWYVQPTKRSKAIPLDEFFRKVNAKKQGGTLNITKVKKFLKGKPVTNSKKKDGANWYNIMYDPFLKYLKTYENLPEGIYSPGAQVVSSTINKDDFIKNFNYLLDSWFKNSLNYSKTSKIKYDPEVFNRQEYFNLTGMNSGIANARDKRLLIPSGDSGDNPKKGYQDGYFGEQEFLRHFGTTASWKGKEKELEEVKNILKGMGLVYYVDNNGMYKIRKVTDPVEELLTVTEDTSTLSQEEREDLHNEAMKEVRKRSLVDGLLGGLNNEIPEENKSWFSQLLENPTLTFGLPRAIAADWVNKRMRDKAIANEKALLLNPFEFNRYVQGNLDAIKLGEQEMTALMNLGEDLSDPTLAYARKFEAFKEGLNRVKQGYLIDNQARLQSQEANWKQTKENALSEYQVGQQNKYSLRESEANKLKYDLAYDAKKHEIWDTLGKQLEYDARLGIQERKAKQELLDKLTRQYNIMHNLGKYMPQLNTDALVLWNEVLNGTKKLSDLTEDEKVLYKEAQHAYEAAVLAETAKAYNLKLNLFIPNSNSYKPDITLLSSKKNGGSIKNADRFYKSIKDDLDRNEKKLDRLFKSLYTLKRRLK